MNAAAVNQNLYNWGQLVVVEGPGGDYVGTFSIGTNNAAPDAVSGGFDGLAAKALLISKGRTVNTN